MDETHETLILLERLSRILQNDSHKDGLRPTQWEALRYLSRANRFSRSPGAVTVYLGMTKGTVSQTLNALERKGLIEKGSLQTDRRVVTIDLTPKGQKVLGIDPLSELERSISQLGNGKASALAAALQSLLADLLQSRGGRSFAACKSCRHFKRNALNGKPHFCALLQEPLSDADGERICIEQEAAA